MAILLIHSTAFFLLAVLGLILACKLRRLAKLNQSALSSIEHLQSGLCQIRDDFASVGKKLDSIAVSMNEIDWEQLRFKIANDVIAEYVSKIDFDEFKNNIPQHIKTTNKLVDLAINLSIKITNILMGELKSNIK